MRLKDYINEDKMLNEMLNEMAFSDPRIKDLILGMMNSLLDSPLEKLSKITWLESSQRVAVVNAFRRSLEKYKLEIAKNFAINLKNIFPSGQADPAKINRDYYNHLM